MNRRMLLALLSSTMVIAAPIRAQDPAKPAPSAQPLVQLDQPTVETWKVSGATAVLSSNAGLDAVRLVPSGAGEVLLTLNLPENARNLSAFERVAFSVKSASSNELTIKVAAMNDGSEFRRDRVDGLLELKAGESGDAGVKLVRRPEDPGYPTLKPYYMYYKSMTVRDGTIDPSAIATVQLRYDAKGADDVLLITQIAATGTGQAGTPPFFPFIDELGQYVHADWPGKVEGPQQFEYWKNLEAKRLEEYKAPADWNEFGGWKQGPKQKATGFFYCTKVDGKWWLVDPSGCLFFSYGPTGVGFGDHSPISFRESWFVKLPPRDGPFGRYYGKGENARYMYYQDKKFDTFNFAEANLLRKYGDDYVTAICDISHKRMKSWGFNTIGNWSDDRIYALGKTPYVVAIHYGRLDLGHHHDVFDPGFQPALRQRMERERGKTAGDKWNIGYFVDNEMDWGPQADGSSVARRALTMPAKQPAKVEFIKDLKNKYTDVAKLNEAWQTKYQSWEQLAEDKNPPKTDDRNASPDYRAFGLKFAERYFTICRDEVKRVAPDNMYLGARFHGHIDGGLMRVAAKYCDAVGYNIYDANPASRLDQYLRIDCPILVGEWGVESDYVQTPFRGAPEETRNWTPASRTRKLRAYMDRGMTHQLLVGAHFFQFVDQPLSGRPDGEATLRGFVNIADTPNFLLIEENRKIAESLYQARAKAPVKVSN